MAQMIAVMTVVSALMGSFVGAWVAMHFKENIEEQRLKELEQMIHEVNLSASEQNRMISEQIKRTDDREINHWNFINRNCKLW